MTKPTEERVQRVAEAIYQDWTDGALFDANCHSAAKAAIAAYDSELAKTLRIIAMEAMRCPNNAEDMNGTLGSIARQAAEAAGYKSKGGDWRKEIKEFLNDG